MTEITINFETLKFNLYEILNVSKDASESKIKKAFRNLILNFHPDKNNDAEEDIYQHIIIANQVLSNKESRKKYDSFLNIVDKTHDDLKKNFNKNNNEPKLSQEEAQKKFENKINELTKKHGQDFIETNTKDNYEKMLKARELALEIPKEEIKDIEDFNSKFQNKVLNKNFGDQIIPVTENMGLSTLNVNDNYTHLDVAFDNLYIDGGGVSTSKYTSLDAAFKIQSVDLNNRNNISIEEAMNNYKKETERLTDPKLKFNNEERFDSW
jgi:curved DNA-binding protein CbpA